MAPLHLYTFTLRPKSVRNQMLHADYRKMYWTELLNLQEFCKVREDTICSGALWQGSNSKIENYGFLAAVTLFETVLQPFLACRRN